jgi:hypothetical protein
LQADQQDRTDQRFDQLQKNARFRYQASIEELQLETSRGMDKGLTLGLATGPYPSHSNQ